MDTTDNRAQATSRGSWIVFGIVPLALFASVFGAFAPALSAEFVTWDDDRNFILNHAYRGLKSENLEWMFTTFHMGHYQPLSWLTLAVDHALFGMDASGYHATNVTLHALTTIAVYFLALRLFALTSLADQVSRVLAGSASALAFGLHPLRVESVAWVTERRDVLAGLFFVLALISWVRYARSNSRTAYGATVVFVLVSLLAKAAAIVMPAVFVALSLWPLKRVHVGWKRLLLEQLPFVAASVVFGWLAIRAQASQGTTLLALNDHGPLERAVQAAFGAAFYLWRTFVPLNLIPIHEIPEPFVVWAPRFLAPAAGAVMLTISLLVVHKRAPLLLSAWTVYIIILSPVSGITQAGPQLVADRYSYFACLPFALAAGALIVLLLRARPERRRLIAGIVLVLSVALGTLTHRQSSHWRDSESLWRHTIAIAPWSGHGNLNLGSVLMHRGAALPDPEQRRQMLDEARTLLERSLTIRDDPQAHVNLGHIALFRAQDSPEAAQERVEGAIAHVRRGLALAEQRGSVKPEWRLALGTALLSAGRCEEALSVLQSVLPALPNTEAALRSTSLAYACTGRSAEALDLLERALALQPDDATLWLRAGALNRTLDRVNEARISFENVVALREMALGPAVTSDNEWKQAQAALLELK